MTSSTIVAFIAGVCVGALWGAFPEWRETAIWGSRCSLSLSSSPLTSKRGRLQRAKSHIENLGSSRHSHHRADGGC